VLSSLTPESRCFEMPISSYRAFATSHPHDLNPPIVGFLTCEPHTHEISDLRHLYSTYSVVAHADRWLLSYRLSRPRNFWLKSLRLQLVNLRVHDMSMPLVTSSLRGLTFCHLSSTTVLNPIEKSRIEISRFPLSIYMGLSIS